MWGVSKWVDLQWGGVSMCRVCYQRSYPVTVVTVVTLVTVVTVVTEVTVPTVVTEVTTRNCDAEEN